MNAAPLSHYGPEALLHSEFDTIPCAKEPREIYVSPGSHYRLGCVSCLRGDESIVLSLSYHISIKQILQQPAHCRRSRSLAVQFRHAFSFFTVGQFRRILPFGRLFTVDFRQTFRFLAMRRLAIHFRHLGRLVLGHTEDKPDSPDSRVMNLLKSRNIQVLMTQDTENGVLITIKGGQIQTEKE